MTPKQAQVMQFLKLWFDEKGYSPTYRDISENVSNCSLSRCHQVVQSLVKDGFIRRHGGSQRGIELVDQTDPGDPTEIIRKLAELTSKSLSQYDRGLLDPDEMASSMRLMSKMMRPYL